MTSITRSGKALNSKNRNISQISEKTVTDKMILYSFFGQMVEISDFTIVLFFTNAYFGVSLRHARLFRRTRGVALPLSPGQARQSRREGRGPRRKPPAFFCATDSPPAGHFRPLTGSAPSWCPPGARKRARAGQDEGRGLQLEGVGRNASRAG